jgi:Cu/Ag efflux protein CusF
MKNVSLLITLLLFVLSSTGWALAQEKGKEQKPAESAKPEAVKKEPPPPPTKYRMGGIISAIDPSAKKITLHQGSVKRERTVTLILGKEASEKLPGMKVGDAVNVWGTGKTVTRLEKVGEGFFFRK